MATTPTGHRVFDASKGHPGWVEMGYCAAVCPGMRLPNMHPDFLYHTGAFCYRGYDHLGDHIQIPNTHTDTGPTMFGWEDTGEVEYTYHDVERFLYGPGFKRVLRQHGLEFKFMITHPEWAGYKRTVIVRASDTVTLRTPRATRDDIIWTPLNAEWPVPYGPIFDPPSVPVETIWNIDVATLTANHFTSEHHLPAAGQPLGYKGDLYITVEWHWVKGPYMLQIKGRPATYEETLDFRSKFGVTTGSAPMLGVHGISRLLK